MVCGCGPAFFGGKVVEEGQVCCLCVCLFLEFLVRGGIGCVCEERKMSLSFCLSLGFFPSLSRGALPRQDRLISTAGSGVGLGYGEKGALSLWRWRKRRVGRSVVTTMAKKEEKPESSTPKWKIGLGLLAVVGALLTPMILPLLDQQAGLSDAEIARRLNQVSDK